MKNDHILTDERIEKIFHKHLSQKKLESNSDLIYDLIREVSDWQLEQSRQYLSIIAPDQVSNFLSAMRPNLNFENHPIDHMEAIKAAHSVLEEIVNNKKNK